MIDTMDFMSTFFILLSVLVLIYITFIFHSASRLPRLTEAFFIGAYAIILIIFMFPGILKQLEVTLGISNALNFIIYLSIFAAYFLIYILYKAKEKQRTEITQLTREIALLKNAKKK
ncbi:MAG: hypothetical protein ACI8Y7_000353 [Candidatus Woesearchaeota archaeon]|jgi:hypothetical protein